MTETYFAIIARTQIALRRRPGLDACPRNCFLILYSLCKCIQQTVTPSVPIRGKSLFLSLPTFQAATQKLCKQLERGNAERDNR